MKLRILPKMILGILLPAVIGLIALTVVSLQTANKGMYNQLFETLKVTAALEQSDLKNLIAIFTDGVAKTFSEVARTARYLSAEADNASTEELKKLQVPVQESVNEVATNYPQVNRAYIVNAKGYIVADSAKDNINQSVFDRDFFKKAMQGSVAIANIKDPVLGITTVIARPIKVGNNILGVACLHLDLAVVADTNAIKLGKTGSVFILDEQGIMLMHGNPKLIGSDESYDPFIQKIMQTKNGTAEYTKNGVDRLSAFHSIPAAGWIVAVIMDKNEAMAPIYQILKNNVIAGIIVSLLVAFVIFIMARSFARTLSGGVMFTNIVSENNFIIAPEMQVLLNKDIARGDELAELAKGIYTMILAVRSAMDKQEEQTKLAQQAIADAKAATLLAEQAKAATETAKREGMFAAAQQIEAVVTIVNAASSQVSKHLKRSDDNAQHSADRMSQTATAMEEMNSTVMEVAKSASSASSVSSKTKENAIQGEHIVQEVINSIQQVEKTSLILKNDMDALNEQAQAISHIMSVISEIADQTNLLALNAAIEAARAGEAGRGFAVVADEVRTLAEKTMISTTDVGNAIRSIQSSTHGSKEQMEITVKFIGKATELAVKSGESLREIVKMVEFSEDQVRAIATACEEQSATSDEISHSLSDVNNIASETSRAMQEASEAMEDLTHQSKILGNLIEEMKNS